MGISGLLPLLKSIQVTKNLSEFSGQTLAVDAYVWLHRGVYACAAEIANGDKTTKYVDYAMHRVRLLRHHKIQPYVVFDGGPLPAKKGTEVERKRRRDENLARGHAFAAQGKLNQAREHYVKCVDVTPQMAFQLIKALRADSISYVVAPYEADAQLAYLERIGLVDGIITEDSDLLVFGCRKVLFKLDAVTSTVTCILRSDFASVTAADSGISLLGWSDVQFRAMAILSGCDYLPSISGVGLKTAWSLLRKHKTPENVVRALRLEGKKDVPRKYLHEFKLAEKVFLHQRVYDPAAERLVNMTPIPDGDVWDEETEAYVGLDMDAVLAKEIAQGDINPVTFLPMEDINPTYIPRAVRVPLVLNTRNHLGKIQRKETGKGPEKSCSASILNFFASKPKPTSPKCSHSNQKNNMVVGRASGKRTLVDVMDQELATKKKRCEELHIEAPFQSRFFDATAVCIKSPKRSHSCDSFPIPLPSPDKENIPIPPGDNVDVSMGVALELKEPPDPVTQEDGYISPSPSCSRWDTPELSSPLQRIQRSGWRYNSDRQTQDDFGVDHISSPPLVRKPHSHSRGHRPRSTSPSLTSARAGSKKATDNEFPMVLVHDTPVREDLADEREGPDLRDFFADDLISEVDSFNGDKASSATPSPPNLMTPEDLDQVSLSGHIQTELDIDLGLESELLEPENMGRQAIALRNETVANGWRDRWAWHGKSGIQPLLRRHETTVTPAGRHRAVYTLPHPYPHRVPTSARPSSVNKPKGKLPRRKSLMFVKEVKKTSKVGDEDSRCLGPSELEPESTSDLDEDVLSMAQTRLARFRCKEAV